MENPLKDNGEIQEALDEIDLDFETGSSQARHQRPLSLRTHRHLSFWGGNDDTSSPKCSGQGRFSATGHSGLRTL